MALQPGTPSPAAVNQLSPPPETRVHGRLSGSDDPSVCARSPFLLSHVCVPGEMELNWSQKPNPPGAQGFSIPCSRLPLSTPSPPGSLSPPFLAPETASVPPTTTPGCLSPTEFLSCRGSPSHLHTPQACGWETARKCTERRDWVTCLSVKQTSSLVPLVS